MQTKSNSDVKYICQYVYSELRQKLPAKYTYHDIRHTMDVVSVCDHYSTVYNLDRKSSNLLKIGAVCHDYGYIISSENHEMISADMASMIMAAYQYQDKDIRRVRGMIMATQLGQQPANLLEEIIADADLDYLGRKDYPEISRRLYDELKATGKVDNEANWIDAQIDFLEDHSYHTKFARRHRAPGKQKRINILLDKKYAAENKGSHPVLLS